VMRPVDVDLLVERIESRRIRLNASTDSQAAAWSTSPLRSAGHLGGRMRTPRMPQARRLSSQRNRRPRSAPCSGRLKNPAPTASSSGPYLMNEAYEACPGAVCGSCPGTASRG